MRQAEIRVGLMAVLLCLGHTPSISRGQTATGPAAFFPPKKELSVRIAYAVPRSFTFSDKILTVGVLDVVSSEVRETPFEKVFKRRLSMARDDGNLTDEKTSPASLSTC
jgi:hypothetical protein